MDSDLFLGSRRVDICGYEMHPVLDRNANNAMCINSAYRLQNQFRLNNTHGVRGVNSKSYSGLINFPTGEDPCASETGISHGGCYLTTCFHMLKTRSRRRRRYAATGSC